MVPDSYSAETHGVEKVILDHGGEMTPKIGQTQTKDKLVMMNCSRMKDKMVLSSPQLKSSTSPSVTSGSTTIRVTCGEMTG